MMKFQCISFPVKALRSLLLLLKSHGIDWCLIYFAQPITVKLSQKEIK